MDAPILHRMVTWVSRGCIVNTVRLLIFVRGVDWRVVYSAPLPPAGTPLLFVSNHIEWHDAPLIGWAIPSSFHLWWFAKAELLAHWMGWWFRMLPMIPVQRGTGDAMALHAAVECVRAGNPMVIFPEGTWDDGRLLRAKTGAVRIALESGALIVPIGVTGRMQPLWFRRRNITFGTPFRLDELPSYQHSKDTHEQSLTDLTTDLMHRIATLLPAEYHGYYARTHISATE